MRLKFSYFLAVGLSAAIGLWMYNGTVEISGQADAADATPPPSERTEETIASAFSVRVSRVTAQPRQSVLELRGRTEASGRVVVRAETGAKLVKRPLGKGELVEKGDILCELDSGTREAKVLETKAMLARAQLDHSAAAELKTKGFATENRVVALLAGLDAAKARVDEAELELDRTVIRAPVSGMIEPPVAEIGALLRNGDACVTILDADPMLVVGQVSERDINTVEIGMAAYSRLITGETIPGTVSYISPSADPNTRTFRTEIELPNPAGAIREGITVMAAIPFPAQPSHKVNSSALTLDDAGRVGIQTVDGENTVRFLAVEVTGSEPDGLWVTGLPENVDVITVGQEYVVDGQIVDPVQVTAKAKQ